MRALIGVLVGLGCAGYLAAQDTNDGSVAEAPPPDMAKCLLGKFDFDKGTQPNSATAFSGPILFKRESPAYVADVKVFDHAPKLVEGWSGKGLLLEDGYANLLLPAQAELEKGAEGFVGLNGATVAVSTVERWQGRQALEAKCKGEKEDEGFALELKVDKAVYNGAAIVPVWYIASVYLKGNGNVKLLLKDAESDLVGDPVFIRLTAEWTRYGVAFRYLIAATNIGANHGADWKSYSVTNLNGTLQLVCSMTENQAAAIYADAFQLEQRFPPSGGGAAAHSWTPGDTKVAPDQFSIDIRGDFFKTFRDNGTVCFWFRPNWEASEGTQEAMFQMAPNVLWFIHQGQWLRLTPAGAQFRNNADWKDNWHHVAITWNLSGKRMLYVDGGAYPPPAGQTQQCVNAASLVLSAQANGQAPNGVIDELVIYSEALTADQISELSSAQPLVPPTPDVQPLAAAPAESAKSAEPTPQPAATAAPAASPEAKPAEGAKAGDKPAAPAPAVVPE